MSDNRIVNAMDQTKNFVINLRTKSDLFIYKHFPGARHVMNRKLSRPAGFNQEVDNARELTIRMKLMRGQGFITRPDAWFLLELVERERNKNHLV